MDFRFRHNTFMEKSALKMIGCLSTKKKLVTKHHFNLREKEDETIVAFNQLIDISIEKKKKKKNTKNRSQLKNVSIKNWNEEVVGI